MAQSFSRLTKFAYLMDFRYNRKFKAKNGEKRDDQGMHGRGVKTLSLASHLGTTVRDAETGKVITDMVEDGQEFSLLTVVVVDVEISALRHLVTLPKSLKMVNQVKNVNFNWN